MRPFFAHARPARTNNVPAVSEHFIRAAPSVYHHQQDVGHRGSIRPVPTTPPDVLVESQTNRSSRANGALNSIVSNQFSALMLFRTAATATRGKSLANDRERARDRKRKPTERPRPPKSPEDTFAVRALALQGSHTREANGPCEQEPSRRDFEWHRLYLICTRRAVPGGGGVQVMGRPCPDQMQTCMALRYASPSRQHMATDRERRETTVLRVEPSTPSAVKLARRQNLQFKRKRTDEPDPSPGKKNGNEFQYKLLVSVTE